MGCPQCEALITQEAELLRIGKDNRPFNPCQKQMMTHLLHREAVTAQDEHQRQ
jgi:hypothetical protein